MADIGWGEGVRRTGDGRDRQSGAWGNKTSRSTTVSKGLSKEAGTLKAKEKRGGEVEETQLLGSEERGELAPLNGAYKRRGGREKNFAHEGETA